MFVHILKDCECKLLYWYDRHWGDRWKEDSWVQRERTESLKAGQVIEAIDVRPSDTSDNCCHVDVTFMADMTNSYLDVPRKCIEVSEEDPEPETRDRSRRISH